MTTAAALSATASAIEALVGLLSLAFSAAPGWRHLRLFSLVAFTAAIYSASSIPQTLGVSAPTIVWASRVSLFVAALHLACWIIYSATAAGSRPRLGRLDRAVLPLLGAVAVLAPIPGALAADAIRFHEVPWLGLRYATAEVTVLGTAAFLLIMAATVIPAIRYVRRARDRVPGSRAHAVGFGVLLLTAVSEALVALGIVHGPYLMDIGFLAAVIAIVGEMSRRVVAEARALAEASSRLEREVEERTGDLRRSEERYRKLLEGMTDAYAAVSMDGAIVEANEAFRQLVGHSMDELGRLTFRDLTPAPWQEAEERILAEQVLRSGSSDVYEKELLRKNGTVVPVELRTFLIRGPEGDPEGMWAIVRDITARKEAQAERERLWERVAESQRLEGLGRLAGGVAHDFNNLLTVVLGSAESLARDLKEGHGTDGEDLAQIEAAALRARDLTNQLLGFARKQIITPRVLDLNDFLHSAERLLRRIIGEDVELRVEPAPGLWPVLCDAGQMEQVILNLASNARDAMPLGGTLAIETRNVPGGHAGAGSTGVGDHVQLVVRDTGVGMTPAVLTHVFEPFYTTKEIGRGTGLGLATVYGIVEQNGGTIRAESAPGRGAEFTIELPRATGAPTSSPRLPATGPVNGGETVLVVEDERLVREVTVRVLARSGYRVLATSNAAEALAAEASERGPIHLLLTDVVMPGRDGKVLAEEIRRRRPTIAVLFVSGYSDEVISRRGVLEEGTSFLAKPYRPGVLLQQVRSVLDQG